MTSLLLLVQVLIPLFTGQLLPAEKLQEVMDGLATALDQFEGLFLQDKPFLVGSEVSLADLVAIVDLMQVTPSAGPSSSPVPDCPSAAEGQSAKLLRKGNSLTKQWKDPKRGGHGEGERTANELQANEEGALMIPRAVAGSFLSKVHIACPSS